MARPIQLSCSIALRQMSAAEMGGILNYTGLSWFCKGIVGKWKVGEYGSIVFTVW